MLLPFWAEDVVSGLWPEDSARSADATPSRSFVLLTTAANPSVAPMHDRMPFIVRDDQFDCWLNNSDPQLPSSIHHLLDKYPLDFTPSVER